MLRRLSLLFVATFLLALACAELTTADFTKQIEGVNGAKFEIIRGTTNSNIYDNKFAVYGSKFYARDTYSKRNTLMECPIQKTSPAASGMEGCEEFKVFPSVDTHEINGVFVHEDVLYVFTLNDDNDFSTIWSHSFSSNLRRMTEPVFTERILPIDTLSIHFDDEDASSYRFVVEDSNLFLMVFHDEGIAIFTTKDRDIDELTDDDMIFNNLDEDDNGFDSDSLFIDGFVEGGSVIGVNYKSIYFYTLVRDAPGKPFGFKGYYEIPLTNQEGHFIENNSKNWFDTKNKTLYTLKASSFSEHILCMFTIGDGKITSNSCKNIFEDENKSCKMDAGLIICRNAIVDDTCSGNNCMSDMTTVHMIQDNGELLLVAEGNMDSDYSLMAEGNLVTKDYDDLESDDIIHIADDIYVAELFGKYGRFSTDDSQFFQLNLDNVKSSSSESRNENNEAWSYILCGASGVFVVLALIAIKFKL